MIARRSQKIVFSLAVLYLLMLVAAAIAAPLLSPYSPSEQYLDRRFHAPSLDNLLGTDNLGRDILTRLLYGARSALIVGVVAVSIAFSLGGLVGLLAGMGPKHIDSVLMLLMDSLLSFQRFCSQLRLFRLWDTGLCR